MKAIGIVLIYDRSIGEPEDIAKKNAKYFSGITETLVSEGMLGLADLKEIMDNSKIFWGGIKEKFDEIIAENESVGILAWQTYKINTGEEPSDEVKLIIYDGEKAPWNFTLAACVIYE